MSHRGPCFPCAECGSCEFCDPHEHIDWTAGTTTGHYADEIARQELIAEDYLNLRRGR